MFNLVDITWCAKITKTEIKNYKIIDIFKKRYI